ncbi:MAG: tRNA (adenosine(37)-N6)-threonylcarbamoyltransferase complex dimerization subunit type 1 TsaB [Proteobacteria bacterium]|nr:tRNA (adenosine(37)-N6)-threonylcarbamoyltransferase complex dimerization subunit type 1 TsaB [Pseudomonadota bacterium]
MNLLGIDTSTRSTVLGLQLGSEVVDRTSSEVDTHSRGILPSIDSLVKEAGISLEDLDAIVFGQGPGSFTGLRIAIGVVQGLGYGLCIPVVPVSSMACIAQSVIPVINPPLVFVGLTARLEEIYYGAYRFEDDIAVPVIPEGVVDVSELPQLPAGEWVGYGNAMSELGTKIEKATGVSFESISREAVPTIHNLLSLGSFKFSRGESVNAIQATPVYLREQVASLPGKK